MGTGVEREREGWLTGGDFGGMERRGDDGGIGRRKERMRRLVVRNPLTAHSSQTHGRYLEAKRQERERLS